MTTLAARLARAAARPLLMRAEDARALLAQIEAADPTATRSLTRLSAWQRARRALSLKPAPMAFDDDGYEAQPLPPGGLAYCPAWMGEPDEELDFGLSLKDGVAVLRIDTAIDVTGTEFCGTWFHGYDTIHAGLEAAFADPRVKGVLISIDSPGGVVDSGIDSVAELIRAHREAAGGVPVWVHADTAFSAAYWIAAQADRILAPRSGMVGSVGAVILHAEASGALDKAGIVVTPITFGARKVDTNDFQPLSDTGRAKLQSIIDQAGRDFISAVTAGRPQLTRDALIATEADIYTAHHDVPADSGLARGFVDAVIETGGRPAEAISFDALKTHIAALAAPVRAPAPAQTQARRNTSMTTPARRKARTHARHAALAALADPKLTPEAAFAAVNQLRLKAGMTDEELEGEEEEVLEGEEEEVLEGEEEETTARKARKARRARAKRIKAKRVAAARARLRAGKGRAEDEELVEGEDDEITAEEEDELIEGEEDEITAKEEDELIEGEEDQKTVKKAKAILALPEARGREAMAQKLAFQKGVSVRAAKDILALSPKAAGRTPQDPPLSSGPGARGEGDIEAAAARAVALLGQR